MTDPQHEDHELRGLLASLREDPADGGFSSQLHRRLVQAGAPSAPGALERLRAFMTRRPVLVGLCAGTCAGAAVFFALRLALASPAAQPPMAHVEPMPERAPTELACAPAAPVVEPSAEVFVIPAGKVAMVQLHFAVDRAVQDAEFSVLLPAALAFFSDGELLDEHSFHWSAPLDAGDNHVPIAIVGQAPGKHRLTATATIAGEVVVHEVVLDVQEPS